MGIGETVRDGRGEGVAPRERREGNSDERIVERPEDEGCRPMLSSSSSVNEIKRRGRTVEVDRWVKVSAEPRLELIPGDRGRDVWKSRRGAVDSPESG